MRYNLDMKKFRKEDLARRYCEYLGLRLEVMRRPDGQISVVRCCSTDQKSRPAEYPSFKGFFFGDGSSYGMCEKVPDYFYDDDDEWNRINDMIIPASNLDELELELAARGF